MICPTFRYSLFAYSLVYRDLIIALSLLLHYQHMYLAYLIMTFRMVVCIKRLGTGERVA